MRFATIARDRRPATVVARPEGLVDLEAMAGGPVPWGRALVAAWMDGKPSLVGLARRAAASPASDVPLLDPLHASFLPPVPDARQVLAVGLNYRSHCAEQHREPPARPMFFAKLVSALSPHGAPIPAWPATSQLDFEGELAVVIGRGGRDIPPGFVADHVMGFTIANDVTARDLQRDDRQWTRAKGLDGFCPMGPYLVTADEVPDPQALRIRTWVDDELRQDGTTADMVFGIDELVHHATQGLTLYPGDILITGTPAGVGLYRDPPAFLRPGNVVRIAIDGLGELVNPVVPPPGR